MERSMWLKLALMTLISFFAMYALMYIMIDKFADFYPNVNQAYMAGSMTAAMVIIELIIMGSMYKGQMLRYALIGVGAVVLLLCILFTQYQTGVYEREFLRSMIPHHSGAILMCSNEKLTDPDVRKLCSSIIEGQQSEINLMKAKLADLNK